ncbi:hypothetical protein [Sphingomonas sp. CFBP 8760]|uniref:hypothetical protein n=1 Tax=Sphingomonas sp. CFBP 8760 TaxID=2775282 RepID=UPI001A92C3A2|nr:hypothetical protein [Sphingomonas sp. CFBP 8760]
MSSTEIMKRAGIARDVLTFWLRNGLLQPMEAAAGRGKHLRFEWYEANIAAVMNQLRILGMKIESMLSIVGTFREAISWAESYGIQPSDLPALDTIFTLHKKRINRLYDDAGLVKMIEQFSDEKYAEARITDRIKKIYYKMPKDEFYQHRDPFMIITEQPEASDVRQAVYQYGKLTYFWRSGEGEKYIFAWGEAAEFRSMCEGSVSSIALDIPTILWRVWNNPEDGIGGLLAWMKAGDDEEAKPEVEV